MLATGPLGDRPRSVYRCRQHLRLNDVHLQLALFQVAELKNTEHALKFILEHLTGFLPGVGRTIDILDLEGQLRTCFQDFSEAVTACRGMKHLLTYQDLGRVYERCLLYGRDFLLLCL